MPSLTDGEANLFVVLTLNAIQPGGGRCARVCEFRLAADGAHFLRGLAGPVSNKKAIGAPSDFIEASVAVIPEY